MLYDVNDIKYLNLSYLGIRNRNRALHGDKVVIDILPETDWRINIERLRDFNIENGPVNDCKSEECTDDDLVRDIKKLDVSNRPDADSDADVVIEEVVEVVDPTPKSPKKKTRRSPRKNKTLQRSFSKDDSISLTMQELKKEYPEIWQNFVQKTGRVVSILEQKHSRCSAGYLKMFPDKNPDFALFSPTDPRFPRMKIAKRFCPKEFFTRPQDFEEFLFVAKLNKWDQVAYGLGELTHNLGSDKDIAVRTQGILIENGINHDDSFSQEIEDALPSMLKASSRSFVIPETEIKKRKDYRKDCVFTIDPLTARDLDDALSIEPIENGEKFKVGVHIADVSYFLKEGSALDREASHRATSVYLVHQVVPMLPRTLCEHLCSLNPGEDRLSFSVEWVLNKEAKIEKIWFGKSVIRSAVKLAYEHAQEMLDQPDKNWDNDELPEIEEPWNAQIISEKVNLLQQLAVKLRQRRFQNGTLRLDQPKLCFSLDKESGHPQGYKVSLILHDITLLL